MKASLAIAFFLPFVTPARDQDGWQAYNLVSACLRFEMPSKPNVQEFASPGGSSIRSYTCQKDDVVFEAIAMELSDDVKMGIQESVFDHEETVSRMILDGSIEGFLEQMETKPSRSEYSRFQKCVSRSSWAALASGREAKLVSVLGKNHAYLFVVSYPKQAQSRALAARFYDSIRLE